MNPKIYLILINLIFGPILLYTYYKGLNSGIDGISFWGGVPKTMRPISGICMIVSALGYFIFTYYLLVKTNMDTMFLGKYNFWLIVTLYCFILIPSCFWMGYTVDYINGGSSNQSIWIIICSLLYTVGIASLVLLYTLYQLNSGSNSMLYNMSLIGCLIFTFHTLCLDGLMWTYFFNK